MFGVKEGHTIFCEDECNFKHHEMLLALVLSKRNDPKTMDKFKDCVHREIAIGWNRNSDIPDKAKYFRFPLVHWAAVYGKLFVLQWLLDQDFDVEVTNTRGETALHRLIACQAHERAVDPRYGHHGRRYSLGNIVQVFSKVLNILSSKCPQLLLRYDYVERNTPLVLCLKLLLENIGTCPRLVQYHQALFRVLCERLVNLIKQEKFSEEFVRNGFSWKDSSGNTIWHVAASFVNETVTSSLNTIMNTINGFDLSVSNSNYETPILVALKSGNQEFAALVEAYKFSNCPVPIVKMEMLSDSEKDECCCEHRTNPTQQHAEQKNLNAFSEVSDRCNGLCANPSHNNAALEQSASFVRDDQSFTEQPRPTMLVEQEKVVLTQPHQNDCQDNTNEMEVDSTSQCSGENESSANSQGSNYDLDLIDGSCSQEQIVIEKQIDLCLSLSQSAENLDVTNSDESMNHGSQVESESSTIENNNRESNILVEALRQADVHENEVFLERIDSPNMIQNVHLPTPPDSSTSPEQCEEDLRQPSTPPPKEFTASKGISVTPVLLIKLLSEPDVSEKFQSLLKDVITGDTAKVDSTQSTLQQLKTSKFNLGCKISSSEEVLETIGRKKEQINEEIRKLQQEICDLETSEEMAKAKLMHLKEEHGKVADQINECESTCNRLKRRLTDCAGALIGLSPKSQKKC